MDPEIHPLLPYIIAAEALSMLNHAAREFRNSSVDASSAHSAPQSETIGGQVIIRHSRKNQSPAPAPSTSRVIASPVKRGAPEPNTTTRATTDTQTGRRRFEAPGRITTGKPVGAPSEEIVKPATVDLIDRFSAMVAEGTSGPKPEKLASPKQSITLEQGQSVILSADGVTIKVANKKFHSLTKTTFVLVKFAARVDAATEEQDFVQEAQQVEPTLVGSSITCNGKTLALVSAIHSKSKQLTIDLLDGVKVQTNSI